uniref:Transmembrane protein n=1 Tax=Steinernema glaseri TaxID=37863 RepID=A0A1I7YN28_9BILA
MIRRKKRSGSQGPFAEGYRFATRPQEEGAGRVLFALAALPLPAFRTSLAARAPSDSLQPLALFSPRFLFRRSAQPPKTDRPWTGGRQAVDGLERRRGFPRIPFVIRRARIYNSLDRWSTRQLTRASAPIRRRRRLFKFLIVNPDARRAQMPLGACRESEAADAILRRRRSTVDSLLKKAYSFMDHLPLFWQLKQGRTRAYLYLNLSAAWFLKKTCIPVFLRAPKNGEEMKQGNEALPSLRHHSLLEQKDLPNLWTPLKTANDPLFP